jgi:hypothetical protein
MEAYKPYKITFDIGLKPMEPHKSEAGTIIYDGYAVTGMRIHVVKEYMDAPVVWHNALIISESMLGEKYASNYNVK